MKRRTILGIFAVMVVILALIATGCVDDGTPKYIPGDIIAEKPTADTFLVILDYNQNTDEYKTNYISKVAGEWRRLSETKHESWDDRRDKEDLYPVKIDHVDLTTVMSWDEYFKEGGYGGVSATSSPKSTPKQTSTFTPTPVITPSPKPTPTSKPKPVETPKKEEEMDFSKPYDIAISTSLIGGYNHFSGKSIRVICQYSPDLTVKFNGKKIGGIRQVIVSGSHISYLTLKHHEEELTSRKIEISGVSYGIFTIDGGAVEAGEWRTIGIKME